MPKQAPSIPLSLVLLIAGTLLVYYVFHANRGHAADIITTWHQLAVVNRLMVVAGCAATAYGLGGILNGLLAARQR